MQNLAILALIELFGRDTHIHTHTHTHTQKWAQCFLCDVPLSSGLGSAPRPRVVTNHVPTYNVAYHVL